MGSCSTCNTNGGTPNGCQNNGLCSRGGCNKLEVFDWLENMAMPDNVENSNIIEVRFKNSRKLFYKNEKNIIIQAGDIVVVDASPGYDVGVVSITGELANIQFKKRFVKTKDNDIRKILRKAGKEEIEKWIKARNLEKDLMFQSRVLAVNLKLEMKISDVEYQGDLSKATFYYTADDRVDFRQLIKDMAEKFKIRIEMRQIGSRQESSRLGGIGSCGRELCCSTWLTDFRTVATSSARYQQLSLNPLKLAGQCGKLKCCLNYELDMYIEVIKELPPLETKLYTQNGIAIPIKTDVFKKTMWYAYGNSSEIFAISPDRVVEIKALNDKGIKPKDLLEFTTKKNEVKSIEYSNVVGQDSLDRFDNKFKNKSKTNKVNNSNNTNNKIENKPNKIDENKNKLNDNNVLTQKNIENIQNKNKRKNKNRNKKFNNK